MWGTILIFANSFANRKTAEIDIVIRRYIQSDIKRFDGGINTYFYVGANPVVRVDKKRLWIFGFDVSVTAGAGATGGIHML